VPGARRLVSAPADLANFSAPADLANFSAPADVANFSARDDLFTDIPDIARRYVITCGEVGSARGARSLDSGEPADQGLMAPVMSLVIW
jgi:hypothetical protein